MNKYLNKTTAILAGLALLAFGALSAIVLGFTALSWHNTAASLKNSYEMKIVDQRNQYDALWKKIKQSAQVPEMKKDAFKEVFNSYAGARSTGGSNQMMTWVKEAVPNVDLKVYDQLMNIITGSRDTWTMKQTELVSIAEQYNVLLSTQPRGFVLSLFGHQKIDPKVITSERTEEAFATGQDNDISLK